MDREEYEELIKLRTDKNIHSYIVRMSDVVDAKNKGEALSIFKHNVMYKYKNKDFDIED